VEIKLKICRNAKLWREKKGKLIEIVSFREKGRERERRGAGREETFSEGRIDHRLKFSFVVCMVSARIQKRRF